MLASILDHSCTPTCAAIFNGRQVQVVAMQKIPPGSITTTATISYISPMEDRETREKQQRRIWHFSCSCSLCTEGSLVDRQKHSLACSSEGCEGGRPILLGGEEGEEPEEKLCTDVVEVEESEDAEEDAEVVELVEVEDSDDAAVKVERSKVEIVEVDNSGQENTDEGVEMSEGTLGTYTEVFPCWQCGEVSEVGEQVREEEK